MSFWKKMGPAEEPIVRRAALEIERAAKEASGSLVANLGIGMPTFIPGVLPEGLPIYFHSENGFVGMGAPVEGGTPDSDIIDAGGRAVKLEKGAACFDSLTSFALVRGGRLDIAVLGAFEVSLNGDLANWMIPGKLTPGMGGGMELAQKAKKVIVMSRHLDKRGKGKLVAECSLPLTAPHCVDTLITDRALFRLRENGEGGGQVYLAAIHPNHTLESALEGTPEGLVVSDNLESWN